MKEYIYFVSYFYSSKKEGGYGNIEISGNQQITGMKMIAGISQHITQQMAKNGIEGANCVVLNYKLLRTVETPPTKDNKK